MLMRSHTPIQGVGRFALTLGALIVVNTPHVARIAIVTSVSPEVVSAVPELSAQRLLTSVPQFAG